MARHFSPQHQRVGVTEWGSPSRYQQPQYHQPQYQPQHQPQYRQPEYRQPQPQYEQPQHQYRQQQPQHQPLYRYQSPQPHQRSQYQYTTTASSVFTPTQPVYQSSPRRHSVVATTPLQLPEPESIRLFTHILSQPSRAVNFLVDYLHLDVQKTHVDLLAGEHKTPAMLRANPGGVVPGLNVNNGEFTLSESTAILKYLADGTTLYPKDKKQRARINEYFGKHLAKVRKLSTEGFSKVFLAKNEAQRIQAAKRTAIVAVPILEDFEALLGKQEYVAGPSLTIADFLFVTEVDQLYFVGAISKPAFPNLFAYFARISRVHGYRDCYTRAEAAAASAGIKRSLFI